MTARAPRVVHLDHTSAPGGAEYALRRMLEASPPWTPALLLPAVPDGVYAPLRGRIAVRTAGVPQPAGASSGRVSAVAAAAAGLAVQAAVTRLHPAFRTADLVDANTARAAAYGALAARTSGVPFVVHLRDLVEPDALGGFGAAMMTRVVLPRADGVIANSRATLATAEPFLRRSALTAVIPSAAGLRPVDAAPSRGAGPLRIGMLARIDPWKGQRELLEAFAAAFPDSDAELEFAGAPLFGHDAYDAGLRDRAVALGVADRVRFAGHVDDVTALLTGWDVAVQYSTRPEPLGQNVLQYLAAGCAVVVADEGGPAEWVDHRANGLRVPPRDVDALARALRQLGEDAPGRRALADAAPRTPSLLSDAEVAAAHGEVYRDLLARTRG